MPNYTFSKDLSSCSRNEIRKEVINWFLDEEPGTGKGDLTSKNKYFVEFFNNYSIYLSRPARLNKGFDFVVNIDGLYFKTGRNKRSYPTHKDIVDALKQIYIQNINQYNIKIKPILLDLFNCKNISFDNNSNLGFFDDYLNNKHPIEIILLSCKWLFIEQDITYWNWSGRNMLYNWLKEENLI